MLDLRHIQLPAGFNHKQLQWVKLQMLWGGVRGGVEVSPDYISDNLSVRVKEELPASGGSRVCFWYSRDVAGRGRRTMIDYFGIVGLSLLDVRSRACIITEGVSDYLSAKLCFPDRNVLGFTTLGGSAAAMRIVSYLFDDLTYYCDNDIGSEVNTGMRAGGRVQQMYEGLGKRVRVRVADLPYKDFTEMFMAELKSK